jgi:hypothetical protein
LLLLGACVPPSVGDAFCGPAAVLEPGGCAFRTCAPGERLDVAAGGCLRVVAVHPDVPDAGGCTDAGLPLLQDGRLACAPSDATCPRGSRRADGAAACERGPRCPAGSLPDGDGCRAIVTVGGRFGDRRVDVGAWAALVFGFDGGAGSREFCQPLQQHSSALDLARGTSVEVGVSMGVPDQDITRVRADVHVTTIEAGGGAAASRPGGTELQRLVLADVGTLLEALRGLGGESTSAAVDVRVRCDLGAVAQPP